MKALTAIPNKTSVFIDANIFALAMLDGGHSGQVCRTFLKRTENRDVDGFASTFVVAEVTHRVMVNEAREQLNLPSSRETVEYLQKHAETVRQMKRHLRVASDIRNFGIMILPLTVKNLHASKSVRQQYGLLTNDSLIVAIMRGQKLRHLATHDAAFDRVSGLQVWAPRG